MTKIMCNKMEDKMTKIGKNLKVVKERKKSYANKKRVFRYFIVVKHVFLKLKVKRSSLRLGCFPKLEARSCEPFEILEKIGPFSYMVAFHASMRVNNVFHVSLLNKYVPELNHIIDWTVIQVEHEGDF
jgi:hypothetical protein